MLRLCMMFAMALVIESAAAQEAPPPPPADPAATAAEAPANPTPTASEAPVEEDDGGRIVGGNPARREDALWQAEIFAKGYAEYTDKEIEADKENRSNGTSKFWFKKGALWFKKDKWELSHRCGGALIEQDWIVTAAHCAKLPCPKKPCFAENAFLAQRGVRLGTLNINGSGRTYRIDRVVIHGRYDSENKINDIALMKIVPDGSGSRPAFAPVKIRILGSKQSDLAVLAKPTVTVTGWGLTGARAAGSSMVFERDGKTFNRKSDVLMAVALKVLKAGCEERYPAAMKSGRVLCAGSGGEDDSCQGDSGGPMTRAERGEPVLVGLVSAGDGCGTGLPGLYVNATEYQQWIKDAIKAAPANQVIHYAKE